MRNEHIDKNNQYEFLNAYTIHEKNYMFHSSFDFTKNMAQ